MPAFQRGLLPLSGLFNLGDNPALSVTGAGSVLELGEPADLDAPFDVTIARIPMELRRRLK